MIKRATGQRLLRTRGCYANQWQVFPGVFCRYLFSFYSNAFVACSKVYSFPYITRSAQRENIFITINCGVCLFYRLSPSRGVFSREREKKAKANTAFAGETICEKSSFPTLVSSASPARFRDQRVGKN